VRGAPLLGGLNLRREEFQVRGDFLPGEFVCYDI